MRLLILLSAMLAGLTGIIAGQPALAHRGEQVAVSATASAEQVCEAGAGNAPAISFGADAPVDRPVWRLHPSIAPRGERRLE